MLSKNKLFQSLFGDVFCTGAIDVFRQLGVNFPAVFSFFVDKADQVELSFGARLNYLSGV